MATTNLLFFVNGQKIVVPSPDPEMTLLQYLRSSLRLTGTKLACGEGGCGACTVMLSDCSPLDGSIRHYSVNACLLPLCSLHGLAVTTVEGIGSLRTRLHPVQERIATAHGVQCGFCTPGFVMSMYSLLRSHPTPSQHQLHSALEGNLCRCTGYRPILDAYRPFTKDGLCALGKECCRNSNFGKDRQYSTLSEECESTDQQNGGQDNATAYDPSQEPIFPPFLKVEGGALHSQSLVFLGPRVSWYRPASLTELMEVKRRHPDCKIVVGNTEIGIDVRFKKQHFPVLVQASRVPELTAVQRTSRGLQLGASVTLDTMEHALKSAVHDLPEEKTRIFGAFVEMLRWFAGQQIRNVASLGGNIMTASPISDLNPLLLACGATLVVASTDGDEREVKMESGFFTGYRQVSLLPTDLLLSVLIPFSQKNEWMFGYKQSTRREDDIAIVNAGMRVLLDDKANVLDLTLAFGGMATTTVLATNTMKQLIGHTWNDELVKKACDLLASDLPLEKGSPGGQEEYRRTLTVSFFFKFYLTVLRNLQSQTNEVQQGLKSSDLLATEPLERGHVDSVQWFHTSPLEEDSPHGALRRPLVQESAYKLATGEAKFLNDITPAQDEIYLALVLSSQARAKLVRVDPSPALSLPGVIDFLSAADVPGTNLWGLMKDEKIFAEDEVINQGQVIGAILADSQTNAQRAAQAVHVEYDVMKPIITIADAVAQNSFYPKTREIESGDVQEALSCAQHILEGEVGVGAQEHFYMEPQGTLAYPAEDGGADLICPSQAVAFIQSNVANALGVPFNKVKCRTRRLGGGFGGKEFRPGIHALPSAIAAVKHQRPVRCILERDEDMMTTGTRHPFQGKYKIAFDSRGKVTAYDVTFYMNCGSSMDLSTAVSERALITADGGYCIPNLRAQAKLCRTNLPSNTAFRGFGAPQAYAILETALTHVASHLNMAPEKVREVNLYREGDITHYQTVLKQCNLRRCWDDVKAQSDFVTKRKEVDLFNSENRWRKRGLAITPTMYSPGFTPGHLNQGCALVNIYTDGTVLVCHGGVEMGQGLHTKVLQVASQALNIPVSVIRVDDTLTNVTPNTSSSAASVSSDLNGAAVLDACRTLMKRLEPIRQKNPHKSWQELAQAAYLAQVPLSATGFYKRDGGDMNFDTMELGSPPYFTFGAAVSMVELDCLTGDHQLLDTHIVMDIGHSLNPAVDVGQIEGAFMQGVGMLTLEQYKVQGDGTLLTRGPGTYKIPSLGNIPQTFTVTLLRESGPTKAVYSSKGVGEPPLMLATSVYCALYEAVRAARCDAGLSTFLSINVPATPTRLRMACSDKFTQRMTGVETTTDKPPWFVDL